MPNCSYMFPYWDIFYGCTFLFIREGRQGDDAVILVVWCPDRHYPPDGCMVRASVLVVGALYIEMLM